MKQLEVKMCNHGGHDLTPSALGTLLVMLNRTLESLQISLSSSRVSAAPQVV